MTLAKQEPTHNKATEHPKQTKQKPTQPTNGKCQWMVRQVVKKSETPEASEVSPDLLVRVLVELVANYWSWPGGGGGYNPATPELVSN